MTYVYAWFAAGISYSVLVLLHKDFRKKYNETSPTEQSMSLVIITLFGPIGPLTVLASMVMGFCKWVKAKYRSRKLKHIQKTTNEMIETTHEFLAHLRETVRVKCDCGHVSKPNYTEDGLVEANWKCPECGRNE